MIENVVCVCLIILAYVPVIVWVMGACSGDL